MKEKSKWRITYLALAIFIGGVIGSSFVNFDLFYIFGAFSGSLLLVLVNLIYVIYTNRKSQSK